MQSNIARWGNSLAVRLPTAFIRAAGLREGAPVEIEITPAGGILLASAQPFDKAAFLKRLSATRKQMPQSEPVVEAMRAAARY